MTEILVTGGCGYKGTVLVNKLLNMKYKVTVVDLMYFGNYLKPNKNLKIIKADIRCKESYSLDNIEIVIHLASIANDPCSELNPKLSWEVICLGTQILLEKAKKSKVKQFIYASSGSVYGLKSEEKVTEDLELEPISEYNKAKMCAERIVLSYSNQMITQIIRPATVCGYSPRMRLDVAVNLLTIQALTKKEIIVLGGEQTRPNIHIDDIIELYIFFIKNPSISGVFNAGFENTSILAIAETIKKKLDCRIIVKKSNDPRSYRVSSDKILETGYLPKKNIEKSINEMVEIYKKGLLSDLDEYYNIKTMKKLKLNV